MRRRAGGRRCGARGREGTLLAPPGGPGQPSAPTTWGCLQWLDAARTKAGESLPDRGPSRAPSAPGSYGPGDRKAAMERREAPAFSKKGTRQDGRLVRRSVLHPLDFARRKKEDGLPGAAKNTGGGALAKAV